MVMYASSCGSLVQLIVLQISCGTCGAVGLSLEVAYREGSVVVRGLSVRTIRSDGAAQLSHSFNDYDEKFTAFVVPLYTRYAMLCCAKLCYSVFYDTVSFLVVVYSIRLCLPYAIYYHTAPYYASP